MTSQPGMVLIVDDDAAIVDALSIIVESEGYSVSALLGGDLVGEIQRRRPALVLLDIWLAGQHGGDICRELKLSPETRTIPIIIVSANRDGRAIARDCGADDFIAKPFDLDQLLNKIAEHIRA
jgi:DNA-binding response OmpR family regulator